MLELETVGQREQVTRKQVEYFLSKKRKPKETFRNQADTTKKMYSVKICHQKTWGDRGFLLDFSLGRRRRK